MALLPIDVRRFSCVWTYNIIFLAGNNSAFPALFGIKSARIRNTSTSKKMANKDAIISLNSGLMASTAHLKEEYGRQVRRK